MIRLSVLGKMVKVECTMPAVFSRRVKNTNKSERTISSLKYRPLSKPVREYLQNYKYDQTAKSRALLEPTSYFLKSRKKGSSVGCTPSVTLSEDDGGVNTDNSFNIPKSSSCLKDVIVALDCEMVICADSSGQFHSLARCSIVNYDKKVLLDLYVKQTKKVVNYLTPLSGITKQILEEKSCVSKEEARELVMRTIEGKLLVGHSINNDFRALGFRHPSLLTIDLTENSLQTMLKSLPTAGKKIGLKSLAHDHLGMVIQKGVHCSIEDATATMEVFKCIEHIWIPKNEMLVECLSTQHKKSYLDDQYWPSDMSNS